MSKVWKFLSGKKSHAIGVLMILSAICQMMGYHQFSNEYWGVLGGGGVMTLRDAIATMKKELGK